MVCQKPHWNRDAVSNSWVWQDSWGAVTPRTPKENSATKQSIDGASLLLVHVTMNPNDTMTISSKNVTRPMPQLCIAVQPPADAPLIENVPFCTQSFGSLLLTHAFHLSCDRSRVGILKDSKPTKSKMQAIGSHSTPLFYIFAAYCRKHSHSFHVPSSAWCESSQCSPPSSLPTRMEPLRCNILVEFNRAKSERSFQRLG